MDNEAIQEAKDELTIAGYYVGVEGDRNYYKARVETPDEWEYEGKLRRIKRGEETKLYAEVEKEAVIIAYRHLEKEHQFTTQAQEIAQAQELIELQQQGFDVFKARELEHQATITSQAQEIERLKAENAALLEFVSELAGDSPYTARIADYIDGAKKLVYEQKGAE